MESEIPEGSDPGTTGGVRGDATQVGLLARSARATMRSGAGTERRVIDVTGKWLAHGAHRTLRIGRQACFVEAHRERIEHQDPADQRFAEAEAKLDRFGGLQHADHARQYAQYAGFRTIRRIFRRGRLREQAAITRRPAPWPACIEHADLPLEALYRAVYQRDAELHAGIVEQVAHREIVGAIQHHVGTVQQRIDVGRGHALRQAFKVHARIQSVQRVRGGIELRHADAVIGVQDLPLQVAALDHVVVRDRQRADARRGEVELRRRTQPARAEHHDPRRFKFALARLAHLGQAQVARIAVVEILVAAGLADGQALVDPARGAAGDRGKIRVSELLQGVYRAQRTLAVRADGEDLAGLEIGR